MNRLRRRTLWFTLLLGLAAVAPSQDDLRADIDNALDKARPALLAHVKAADNITTRSGELALLLLAAIHDGVPADDPAFASAMRRLAKHELDQTYDLSLRLLVLEAWPAFPDRLELAKSDAKELLKHRTTAGAFHYRKKPKDWDLSNTQYAALGLRAARAIGVDVDRAVWAKMAQEIGAQQGSYGGFDYSGRAPNGGEGCYASMTAAGIAVLAICKQCLGEERKPDDLAKKIERGWSWFARNKTAIGSPTERWSLYFHYGLERAAILCDVETIDDVDWYAKGARMLVDRQLPGGGWISETDGYAGTLRDRGLGNGVHTAFAVLFLRRKFQKTSGPITPHIVTLAAVGPMSKQGDIDACAAELVRRGKEAVPDVLQALRSRIEQQRRAAAAALLAIAGDAFGYDPAADEARNLDAVRKAELWHLKNR